MDFNLRIHLILKETRIDIYVCVYEREREREKNSIGNCFSFSTKRKIDFSLMKRNEMQSLSVCSSLVYCYKLQGKVIR